MAGSYWTILWNPPRQSKASKTQPCSVNDAVGEPLSRHSVHHVARAQVVFGTVVAFCEELARLPDRVCIQFCSRGEPRTAWRHRVRGNATSAAGFSVASTLQRQK